MTTKKESTYVSSVSLVTIISVLLASGCFFTASNDQRTRGKEIDMTITKEERFAEVFQRAIDVAERRLADYDPEKDPLRRSGLENIIRILRNQKQVVLTQGVEVYDGSYGPGYHVIDLGEPSGSELSNAVYEIEVFYKNNYIALMTNEERLADMLQRAIELAEDYDSDTDQLTKEQLASLRQKLSEMRQKVITEGVERYEEGQYGFVRKLYDWGVPVDSALSDAVREIEVFHREKSSSQRTK